MIDYCTDQWLILKYPCGAGGKFIANCLFLFDSVAHWHGIQTQEETVKYFRQTMLDPNQPNWLNRELNHKWNLNFFSRSYQRNNDLSKADFNQLVNEQGSEYFRDCWNKKLTIVDHWSKPLLPKFWKQARTITIDIDDYSIYESLVMIKLYAVRQDKIISMLDAPEVQGSLDNIKYASQFQNLYEFPLMDFQVFFEKHVKQQPWLEPWLNYKVLENDFTFKLSELIDKTKFINKFMTIEEFYQQKIPVKYLHTLHDTWMLANEQQYKFYSDR